MITTIWHNCANWYIMPNSGKTGFILVPFVISLVRQILWMRHLNWITQEMTLCMWSLVLNFKKVVVFHVWVQLKKLVVIHTHVGTFYLMVLTHPIFETTTDIKYISKFVKYRQLLTSLAAQSCTFWKCTVSWGVQTSGSLTMIFLSLLKHRAITLIIILFLKKFILLLLLVVQWILVEWILVQLKVTHQQNSHPSTK